MPCFVADRGDGFNLAQLFGVPLDRFAVDKKLVTARRFDPHAIRVFLITKALNGSLGTRNAKLREHFYRLRDSQRVARGVAVVWRALARYVTVNDFCFHMSCSIARWPWDI